MTKKILQGKESASVASNNSNELLVVRRQKGVFTHSSGQLTKAVIATGLDPTYLGRWNWMQLKGYTFTTCIITAHQSVKSRTTVGTTFLQRERQCRQINIRGFPRKLFADELINVFTKIRAGENTIVLAADINERAVEGKLSLVLNTDRIDRIFL